MLRIQDFMTTKVKTIDAEASAEAAAEFMRQNRIHHLVVTRNQTPVGVITSRDLGGPKNGMACQNKAVADLMTARLVTVGPQSTLREAANMLRGHSIGCVPVVSEGRLAGIVTLSDLLELIGRGVHRPTPKGERQGLQRRASAYTRNR